MVLGAVLSSWVLRQVLQGGIDHHPADEGPQWPTEPRFRVGMGLIMLGGVLVTWKAINP
jgi:hypothetical protein